MLKKLAPLALLVLVVLALAPVARTTDSIAQVFVTNFQNPQNIAGTVEVRKVIPHAELARSTDLFPRYRVLLYNSTDKSAAVNLYTYLTN